MKKKIFMLLSLVRLPLCALRWALCVIFPCDLRLLKVGAYE